MKPIDVKTSTYNDLMLKTLKKIVYLKLVIKGYTPVALQKILTLKKLKTLFREHIT